LPFSNWHILLIWFLISSLIIQRGNKTQQLQLVENIYLKCINEFHTLWVFLRFYSVNSLGKLILNINEINITICIDCKTQTKNDVCELRVYLILYSWFLIKNEKTEWNFEIV